MILHRIVQPHRFVFYADSVPRHWIEWFPDTRYWADASRLRHGSVLASVRAIYASAIHPCLAVRFRWPRHNAQCGYSGLRRKACAAHRIIFVRHPGVAVLLQHLSWAVVQAAFVDGNNPHHENRAVRHRYECHRSWPRRKYLREPRPLFRCGFCPVIEEYERV